MNRHFAIAGTLVLAGLAAWWALGAGPSSAPAVDAAADEADTDGRKVTRFAPSGSEVAEGGEGARGAVGDVEEAVPRGGMPSDPLWAPLHGQFRQVMGSRVQVVVPEGATPAEVQELQLDAIDARSTELDDLIVELTELAETTSDPATRVDALTSLGEVYVELAATVESTPVPDWMKPRRAARMEDDIANRSAIAIDKARMVFEMARSAGGDAMGAEAADRIRAGLEATQ